MPTSFFHGVTVTLIDTGPRPIAIPSSSIIGLVDTYTPAEGLAEPNKPILLTSYREAVKQFGAGSALGFSLVLVLFAGIRERMEGAEIPRYFQGTAIAMVTAGLMALAFMGFAGLDKYQ